MTTPFYSSTSDLSPDYVLGGKVTKTLVYKSADTEVSILKLAPGARIKLHEHPQDSELYFDIGLNIGELCPIGESHEFYNDSPTDTVSLLSVKTTKSPEIREDENASSMFVFGV